MNGKYLRSGGWVVVGAALAKTVVGLGWKEEALGGRNSTVPSQGASFMMTNRHQVRGVPPRGPPANCLSGQTTHVPLVWILNLLSV